MASNPAILEWQNALPSFGIPYSGPKDGQINKAFIEAIMAFEAKYNAYSQIFTGSGVRMSVVEAKKKFIDKSTDTVKSDESLAPTKIIESPQKDESLKVWESFLSQNLPVVGKVYDGDLAIAGKKLEAAIGKSINKPMAGIIWSDAKKQFNTTPDDIKKALEFIQTHSKTQIKSTEFTLDQRVIKMSQLMLEKN